MTTETQIHPGEGRGIKFDVRHYPGSEESFEFYVIAVKSKDSVVKFFLHDMATYVESVKILDGLVLK